MTAHESFMWMDAAVAQQFTISSYRMGAIISNVVYSEPVQERSAFTTNFIIPDDVNPDDRFRY